ncbi:MAG: zinc ABC transporter permease [Candidatus Dactylopiibacterium carminicum]|uniref:Metal ABC transporter permease n=1 Tax=Candidatus Dactylopiibacterium carminicum TaxID=857335 RepID=A0A272ESA6_9RHOO|nr:metal ABC transporter permease [Candidatus Dactylopiibacterium carminicum]KAF7600679.1 metal ABC transporter permease [Candidatus Dactylopiibacterium carminicum]PAS92982.1 MAG: zinc ABC transporter permease [Candidatus Dactylopiibacterium carminicum]PAS96530.1 MAG: zinc ABC transporter permease [Candidatus Dactylopiibacterium carminicum]PAT00681.1 MAG: zinc ABC transporter permease [Candidatus Dactylopiibacterium carminicum]
MALLSILSPLFEFGFMQRALVGSLALSLSAAPLGVFLMLRRMSLTGDAMAHGILPGAALGYLIAGLSVGAMTIGGIIAGLAVAVASGLVARSTVLREDTSLASFYLISLALGVLLVSTRGSNVDLLHVLFGTVLALNDEALWLLGGVASVTLLGLAMLFRPLVLECLDPGFLRSVSRWSPVAHYGFLALLVLNLVAGFHALGTLMAVGYMVLPAAASRFWVREITPLLSLSALLAFAGSLGGLLLSYHADLPTGPAIVLCLGLIYLVSLVLGRQGLLCARLRQTKHLRA